MCTSETCEHRFCYRGQVHCSQKASISMEATCLHNCYTGQVDRSRRNLYGSHVYVSETFFLPVHMNFQHHSE